MIREPVSSSNVASVGYDQNTMTLEVEYKSGAIYQYFDVPDVEYRNLIAAESIGRYLSENLKNNYRYSKI